MEKLLVAKVECIEDLLAESLLKTENSSQPKQKSVIIKTITKKVPHQEIIQSSDVQGSLAVINLNEEECSSEEKSIKNNLTVITNYLNTPEGQAHFISVDMKSISVPCNTALENEEEAVGTVLNDTYSICIDEGCEMGKKEKSSDDICLDLESGSVGMDPFQIPETAKQIKVDKDDPCSRLHFVKFLRIDGEASRRIWQCGICGKEFKHQYTLLRHVTMHTDERNYTCEVCGKAFRLMSTLSQHRAIHRAARPYVCGVCKKTFSRVTTLISHRKIHYEDKKYKCSICHKSFHQKGNLKNHFFTHTDERPFRCDLCGKGFNQLSNLSCHKTRAHLKNINHMTMTNSKYKCSCCNLSFIRKAQQYQHEEHCHGIENIFSSKKCIKPSPTNKPTLRKKKMDKVRLIQSPSQIYPELQENTRLFIDEMDTEVMRKCEATGRVPYALLKPLEGSSVLVKVCPVSQYKNVLVPASAEELKSMGKFTVTPQTGENKAVQVEIPVVACIKEYVKCSGQLKLEAKTPSKEELQMCDSENSTQILTHEGTVPFVPSEVSVTVDKEQLTQHFVLSHLRSKETILIDTEATDADLPSFPFLQDEKLIQVEDCLKADDLENNEHFEFVSVPFSTPNINTEKDEILDLNDSVQYLKPTGVMGEYELIDPLQTSETHQIKPIPDGNTYLVDPSQFSNLMGVLQLAGYELNDEDTLSSQLIYSIDRS